MQQIIIDPKMYCDRCGDNNTESAVMEIRNGRWACPRCGKTKEIVGKPLVCTVCSGPWPECFEGCKLFA